MDKTALFKLSYGVYVISSLDDNKKAGCVVNSIFQVSSAPAAIAVSINKANYTNNCVIKTGRFVISVLSEDADAGIIGTFGFKSGRDVDKFENFESTVTGEGIPVLKNGVCAYIDCKVINTVDCFTHTIIIAEIKDAVNLSDQPPMTYAYYHKVLKGKSPKNAPTYTEDDKTAKSSYYCGLCGYEYPGSGEEFLALPDSYVCPVCGASKDVFKLK